MKVSKKFPDLEPLCTLNVKEKRWLLGICIGLLALHLVLMAAGTFERSADGWIHLFFSDHWQHDWWNDWEPRWYTGFSVFSYPPLAHQLTALLVGWLKVPAGGILAMFLFTASLLWGLHRYTRCWFSELTAWLTVILLLSHSSLSIALHVFGQLPNILALALILHAIPWIRTWLLFNYQPAFWPALLFSVAAALTNLYASVFGLILFALPVLIESWRQQDVRWKLTLLGLACLVLGGLALMPHFYFQTVYAASKVTPIFHSSRVNVLAFKPFNWFMFYGHYGVFLLVLPFWILSARKTRAFSLFVPSVTVLGILSLGGTTPFAVWLLGPLFNTVTLDRFAQWNGLLLSILVANWLLSVWRNASSRLWLVPLLGFHICACAFSAGTMWLKPLPELSDLTEIQSWLEQPEVRKYRYLTQGVGRANFAKLSTQVPNQTVDGNFPFGRNLALLNESGLSSLDDAVRYGSKGWYTLENVLNSAESLHLKYVLNKNAPVSDLLVSFGWSVYTRIGDITVWSKESVASLPAQPKPFSPIYLRLFWGGIPLMILLSAFIGAWRASRGSERFFTTLAHERHS